MSKIKDNILLALILILFLSVYFFHFDPNADLWWDSSVYIGMGKYIYSAGEVGLYEASRPLVWPLMLGFFWKLGLDVILCGRLLVLIFGVGTIILTYLMAYELFDRKIALLSSLFLAFSPTFFFFNSIIFTGIPSAFFVMFGLYLFIKKRYKFSGLFFGIALMTRFFQVFFVFPVYLFGFYLVYKKKLRLKQLLKSVIFLLIPLLPYLILNSILFNDLLYPFLLQSYMVRFTGWVFHQPFSFYFVSLARENIIFLFSVVGLVFVLRKERLARIIPFVFLLAFIPYNLIPHKEMRFLLPLLPLLSILAVYGIVQFSSFFKKYKNIMLLLILFIWVFNIDELRLNTYDDKLDTFYSFMENNKIREGLWISNPSFIVYTNSKADQLIYYPLYNTDKITKLKNNIDNAEFILINTCDIMPCPPSEITCTQEHYAFMNKLKEKFELNLYKKEEECEYYIFTSS